MSEHKPGDVITITLDGVPYETVIDERGVQRFREDPAKQPPKVWDRATGQMIHDMNGLAARYRAGEFSKREYAEMNMAVGYSVSGFGELSTFQDMRLINPLWDNNTEGEFAGMDDVYLFAQLASRELTLSQVIEIMMKRDNVSREFAEAEIVNQLC